ncbi:hypothetical protein Hanom_Chr00s002748g01704451 [Helianthus anomalus]
MSVKIYFLFKRKNNDNSSVYGQWYITQTDPSHLTQFPLLIRLPIKPVLRRWIPHPLGTPCTSICDRYF